MLRKTKLIYIMGSAVIGVLTVLTVLFAMISTGVIDGRQKKVVFASASAVFTYDGQEHTETQWEIKDGELKSGHTAKVVVSGTQTEVGESVNHISGVILDEQGADVTSDYVIEYAPGTLAVQKRAVGVRSGDGVKNYDGTPLTCDEYEIADGELAEGQTLECRVTGSIVAAGSQENSFVATIRDEKGNDKTENYAVTYLPGTLTVNRRKVVFGSIGAEKDYDGEKLVKEECEITAETSLVDGDTYKSYFDASVTDAGSVDNEFTVKIFDKQGNENGSNYDIEYRYGRLTVKPLSVTFKSGDASVTYGDTELTCKTVELTAGRILDAHSYEGVFSAAQKEVGTTENKFTVVIKDADGADKTHNYDITYAYGNLTVTKRPVQFSSANREKVYDDTPLDNGDEKATITSGSLVPTHNFVAQFSESITDAGSVDNEFTVAILNVLGEDKSGNYEISYVNGTLTVNKCPVQFTSDGAERVYDGTSLECTNKPRMTAGTLADGHDYTPNFTVKVVEAGERDNEFTVRIADGNGADKTENYAVDCVYGKLIISKRPITIQTDGETFEYDAAEHYNEGYTVLGGELVGNQYLSVIGHTVVLDANGRGEDNELTFAVLFDDADGRHDTTGNYLLTVEYRPLVVTPRRVTVASQSASREYNGQPLTCDMLDGEPIGILPVHSYTTTFIGERTNAGASPNTFELTILDEAGGDVSRNYDIAYNTGTLSVQKIALVFSSESANKVFDGTELRHEVYSLDSGELVNGEQYEVVFTGSVTEVMNNGSLKGVQNKFRVIIYKEVDGSRVITTDNYDVQCEYGVLEITPYPIMIVTQTKRAIYTGAILTDEEYSIETNESGVFDENGKFSQYECIVKKTGKQDGAGSSPNKATAYVRDKNTQTDVSYNFTITYFEGSLIVAPRPLTIKSKDATKPYDGTELICHEFNEPDSLELLSGHRVEVVIVGSRLAVGESDNTIGSVWVFDADGNDVTSNYEVTKVAGTLTVTGDTQQQPDEPTDSDDFNFNDPERDEKVVMKVNSTYGGKIYFRNNSYGDYTGKGWAKADETALKLESRYSMNYLTSFICEAQNRTKRYVTVSENETGLYLLPYYLATSGGTYSIQNSDVTYTAANLTSYKVPFYPSETINPNVLAQTAYTTEEEAYRAFVYSYYTNMSLPTGSKLVDYLNSIIDEKGWSKDSPDILNEVASYIRNCAKYTLDFDSNIYKQEDMVYAFLTIYKQGICQHFAAAGTLMFRELGFPARYVTGMVATVKANVLTEVKNTQGHAWVEVYLDGKGWVPVEVTGGGPGTDDGDDNNGRTALTITPVTTYAQYTNQTIYPKQEVMGLSKLKGYTYDVDISGEKSSAGTWTTNIESFVLYDADGNDVTNEFAITYKVGKLQIYYSIIEVTTISMEKMYDGKPLTCSTQPTYTGGLMPGHKITFKMTASVTDVDLSNVTKNTAEVNIIDENNGNANVTGQYKIVKKFGTLTITRRTIKIITASDSRVYNGTALVCHERQLEGSLADGDELSITFTGSQTEVGSSENTAIVKVLRNGVNVTSNYNISTQRGTLTVTAPKDI